MSSSSISLGIDPLDSGGDKAASNQPDVTKPEPAIKRNGYNNYETFKTSIISIKHKPTNLDSLSLHSIGNQSLVSALLDAKSGSTSGYESKGSATLDKKPVQLHLDDTPTYPLSNSSRDYDKLNLKYYDPSLDNPRTRSKTRSKSNGTRSNKKNYKVTEDHKLANTIELSDKKYTQRISRISQQVEKMNTILQEDQDIKPPLPPRTDKMPKDFRPPVPPKHSRFSVPRVNIKDHLMNNMKLGIRFNDNSCSSHKRTKLKLKLLQRAQNIGLSNCKSSNKNKKGGSSNVVLTKYKKLEPSLSMPYNLGKNIPTSEEHPIKHSQSTLSMPSFLWEGVRVGNPAGSMPDLLMTDSDTSSEYKASSATYCKSSSYDPTFLEANYLAKQMEARNATALSSSNSDITSEQSGWVSSRHTSLSTSPQGSPAIPLYADTFDYTSMVNNDNSNTVLTTLSDPPPSRISSRRRGKPIATSPDSNHRVSKSDSKVHDAKTYDAHNAKAAPHERLKRLCEEGRKELATPKSMSKIVAPVYEDCPLPPPPKEFQDPTPHYLKRNGFATTGRVSKVHKKHRKYICPGKDRPRSESPKTEKLRVKDEQVIKQDLFYTRDYIGSMKYEAPNNDTLKLALPPKKPSKNYDKFNSLPSMKKNLLPLSTMTQDRRSHKKENKESRAYQKEKKSKVPPPDVLSEPTPSNARLQICERSRTQSAPHTESPKDSKYVNRIRSRLMMPGAGIPTHLSGSKCDLLELFLEQQDASSQGYSSWRGRRPQNPAR